MVSPIFGGTIFFNKNFLTGKSDLQVKNSYAIYVTRQENVFLTHPPIHSLSNI